MSKGKIIGKIITAVTIVLVLAFLACFWYLGGQKRAIERYCSSIARGNASDYNTLTGSNEDADTFKASQREKFKSSGSFNDLEDNSVIGYEVRLNERRFLTFTRWECTADVDLFSGNMSKRCEKTVFTLEFIGGSWHIDNVSEVLI